MYPRILPREAFCHSTVIALHQYLVLIVLSLHSWYFPYVFIHSWLIQWGQVYESETYWNEAVVEIQYFYYAVISPRDETGTRRLCYKWRRCALVGRKRIKTCAQSNDQSMLTWHLISHRERTLNAFIILQCTWLTALNVSVLLYQVSNLNLE